ncbi:DUF6709 family protein [Butyrivibrio hungatei]|uniref:Uncharacterized protein n=1 Tax=Butyrivibrio hungatei TaxID=185008 RepID=A0A1D9P133_9FIRM|nr:DUF6709 family protein [Butyrivibrio hungatei]AOZ96074.1 hypothetical protein bhn_I1040 [Butyrivibrio hungatei]
MNNGEKKGFIWCFLLAGVFIVLGAWYYISMWGNIVNAYNDSFENYDTVLAERSVDESINNYYELDIDASFGCFATETKDGDVDKAYYLVWLNDDSIAAVEVNRKADITELDRIVDETWAYLNYESDTLSKDKFSGTVKVTSFGGNLHTMYRQTLDEIGITDENYVIRDILFDYSEGRIIKHDSIVFGVFGVIGIAMLIFFIVAAVLPNKGKISGTALLHEKMDLVSYKHAKERIKNPEIKASYKKLKRAMILWFTPGILLLLIPGCLYAYTAHANKATAAEDRQAQYDLADSNKVNQAKENETAQITLTKVPSLIFSENDETYYILDYNGFYFVAIIDSNDFNKIRHEIDENGKYTLYGFLQEPSDGAKNKALEYVNEITGKEHQYSEYDQLLGKYALNVEEDYAGVGVPIEKIKNFMIGAAIFIICSFIFGFSALSKYRYMVTSMRHLSDMDYEQMEKELESANVTRYPQNLIFTENYLVHLHSSSIYRDSTDKESLVLFTKYSDIKWIYPSNRSMNGTVTNYGIAVYGPQIGTCNILSLPTSEKDVQIINGVINHLLSKCPQALFGYNDENKQKLGM